MTTLHEWIIAAAVSAFIWGALLHRAYGWGWHPAKFRDVRRGAFFRLPGEPGRFIKTGDSDDPSERNAERKMETYWFHPDVDVESTNEPWWW